MKPHAKINNTLTGEIINVVCDVWNVDRATLVGKCRRRPLPWVRAQLCHYLRRYAGHDTVSCAAISMARMAILASSLWRTVPRTSPRKLTMVPKV